MPAHLSGILVGGLLPAVFYGISNVFAKSSANTGMSVGLFTALTQRQRSLTIIVNSIKTVITDILIENFYTTKIVTKFIFVSTYTFHRGFY